MVDEKTDKPNSARFIFDPHRCPPPESLQMLAVQAMRPVFEERLEQMAQGERDVEVVELEDAVRLAADLDARTQPEGQLTKKVRELFETWAHGVHVGEIAVSLPDLEAMARLVAHFDRERKKRIPPRARTA